MLSSTTRPPPMPITVPQVAPTQPPLWLTAEQLQPRPAAELHSWLFDQHSLTRKLSELADGQFSVLPLLEGWQTLRHDECLALNVAAGSQGWVREVYLRGHQQPWVFARSVAARSALEGSTLDLAHLGNRSLGELLFSDHAFQRGPLQACHYPVEWLPNELRCEQLWARRSRFSRDALALLVVEVFLPSLWQQTATRAV